MVFFAHTRAWISPKNGSQGNGDGGCAFDLCVSGEGLVVGSCEHHVEPLGSLKGGEFLD
jgi:hypothetical protein